MKRTYVVSKGAAADLREVVTYTMAQWGEVQCRSYLAGLEDATDAVARGHGVFKDLSSLLPGLRMARFEKHCIFCMRRDGAPAIVLAVFHERMDLLVRLKERL